MILKYFGSKYFLTATETTHRNVQIKESLYNLQLLKEVALRKLELRKMLLKNIHGNRHKLAMILNQTWRLILKILKICPTCQLHNLGKNTNVGHGQVPNS